MNALLERVRAAGAAIALDPAGAFPRVLRVALVVLAVSVVIALVVRAVRRGPVRSRSAWPVRWVNCGFLLVVVVLAATAFVPIVQGRAMSGWPMLIHVAVAGAFVVLLPAVAILGAAARRAGRVDRVLWFGLVAAGAATAAAMLIAMLPILSTAQLQDALTVHRYTSLLTVGLAVLRAVLLK